MSLNVIDWLRETGAWIAKDRPDIYDAEGAVEELSEFMDVMRNTPGDGLTSFGDYMLIRHYDEENDIEEWDLVRKISSVVNYFGDGEVWVAGYTEESQTVVPGVNLPDASLDLDEDD